MVQLLFIGMNEHIGGSNIKETGVLNTFLVVGAENCKETIESVRLMFDSVDLTAVNNHFANATVVFPNDEDVKRRSRNRSEQQSISDCLLSFFSERESQPTTRLENRRCHG